MIKRVKPSASVRDMFVGDAYSKIYQKFYSPSTSLDIFAARLGLEYDITHIINEAGNNQGWPPLNEFKVPIEVKNKIFALFETDDAIKRNNSVADYYVAARKDLLGDLVNE